MLATADERHMSFWKQPVIMREEMSEVTVILSVNCKGTKENPKLVS